MNAKGRNLTLDICNYRNEIVCNIYDSSRDMPGQATDVFMITERNGWKELSFKLPSMCPCESGIEDNYRLHYLIADYRIRCQDDFETDWFFISEPKISHNAFSKNVEVRANHISQILKGKNLGLEFSDDEGNNIGTAKQLLTTILEGTGWYVGDVASFIEEDINPPTEKVRSLVCSAKTGAFRMIELLCEKFDAKPVYHGEGYPLLEKDPGDMNTNYSAYCKLSPTLYYKRPLGPCIYLNGAYRVFEQLTSAVTFEPDTYYRYKVKSVDIVPMNPFSEDTEEGEIPALVVSGDREVLELHYEKGLKDITRTLNTENISTKLYAYGNYGDLNGLCSIQNCFHDEYMYLSAQTYASGTEFRIVDSFGAVRYFTIEDSWTQNTYIVWSKLDFASRSYVWSEQRQKMYNVYKEPKTTNYIAITENRIEQVRNYFPALFNFDYYEKIGLLDNSMKNMVATYQRTMPEYYQQAEEAALNFANGLTELSEIANSQTGFLRLAIKPLSSTSSGYVENSDGSVTLMIDTDQGDHGVLYRSDYIESKRKYFEWHVAKQLKPDGEPTSGSPSTLMVIHNTNPVTWERFYLKKIKKASDEVLSGVAEDYDYGLNMGDEPEAITIWGELDTEELGSLPPFRDDDRFYLFCTVSTSGTLGSLIYQDWAIQNTQITTSTTVSTETHPFYFVDSRWTKTIQTGVNQTKTVPYEPTLDTVGIYGQYGWYYRYYATENRVGSLFFCGPKDTTWKKVYMQDTEPALPQETSYFFNTELRTLWISTSTGWVEMESAAENRIANSFSQVWLLCRKRDMIYNGIYEKYNYTVADYRMVAGRYLINSGYDFYWAFTTDQDIDVGNTIYIDTQYGHVYQDNDVNHIVSAKSIPDYVVKPMPNNILSTDMFVQGSLDSTNGNDVSVASTENKYRTRYINVYPGYAYESNLPSEAYVHFYDEAKNWRGCFNTSAHNWFIVPEQSKEDYEAEDYVPDAVYIRVYIPDFLSNLGNYYIRMRGYNSLAFINDNSKLPCTVLSNIVPSGLLKGLNYLTKKFADLSDAVYMTYLGNLTSAQNAITEYNNRITETLGDMLREGYWQESEYVEGDEAKLYRDAMDNLKVIAHPEATYSISYLDAYGSNADLEFSLDGQEAEWRDIQIVDAVHLVDPDIDVNTWAYIDKIEKCYDQPWKTTIEINTKLSLIGQHDFTDVMTHIAEVANESKAKQSLVDRINEVTTSDGYVYASQLIGEWEAKLKSTVSNWYTDSNGNIVFEAADGMSAMMLTGSGFCVSNKRDPRTKEWMYTTIATGEGVAADAIVSGYLNVERIENHTITSDKLASFVGHDLDISTNKALSLYATADGLRPSGALKTTDSIIEIAAGSGNTPAHINIATGGQLNLTGASMNLKSSGSIVVEAGSSLQLSGGTFSVTSGNFSIDANGNVTMEGNITASSGKIGGWIIGQGYFYAGSGSSYVALNTLTTGDTAGYAFWAGSANPENAYFSVKNTGTIQANVGKIGGFILENNDLLYESDKKPVFVLDGNPNSEYAIWAGKETGVEAPFHVKKDGTMFCKNAEIEGTVNAKKGFIGGDSSTGGWAIQQFLLASGVNTTRVGLNSDSTSGANIAIWAGAQEPSQAPFKVTRSGVLYARGADIEGALIVSNGGSVGGWTIGSDYIGTASTLNGSTVGIRKSTTTDTVVFWAGAAYNATTKPFSVTADGKLTANNVNITGGQLSIGSNFSVSTSGALQATGATISGTVTITGGSISIKDGNNVMFSVSTTGVLTAKSGTVGGWYIGEDYIGNANTYYESNVGLLSSATGDSIALWARSGNDRYPEFFVTANGSMTSTKGAIGGWNITDTYLSSAGYTVNNVSHFCWLSASDATMIRIGTGQVVGGNTFVLSTDFSVSADGSVAATKILSSGIVSGGSIVSGTTISATTSISAGSFISCNDFLYVNGTETAGDDITNVARIVFGNNSSDYPRLVSRKKDGKWQLVWLYKSGSSTEVVLGQQP